MPVDRKLLAALEAGLPPCSGVALGIDRLVMVALNLRRLNQVVSFDLGGI
jgi:elongation factor P--(R)-beta-lysine ligase